MTAVEGNNLSTEETQNSEFASRAAIGSLREMCWCQIRQVTRLVCVSALTTYPRGYSFRDWWDIREQTRPQPLLTLN